MKEIGQGEGGASLALPLGSGNVDISFLSEEMIQLSFENVWIKLGGPLQGQQVLLLLS